MMRCYSQPAPSLAQLQAHVTARRVSLQRPRSRVVAKLATPSSPVSGNGAGSPAPAQVMPLATPIVTTPSAAPSVPQAPAAPECSPPPAIYAKAVEAGAAKALLPAWKQLLGGFLGGAFISFGAALALCVGGACPGLAASNPGLQKILLGAVGLPFGLLMVVATGAELFTGNTALLTVAAYEGRVTPSQLLRNWVLVYAGNLAGSLALVAAFAAAGVFPAAAAAPIAVAKAKTSLAFSQIFVRGVLCNWLVCMSIWQALATSSFFGKALACLLPVSAFVAMGLEHSVANMFMVPMGMALGAPVSWGTFLMANLLPATLGNVVGGAVCVATCFALFFGRPGRAKQQPTGA